MPTSRSTGTTDWPQDGLRRRCAWNRHCEGERIQGRHFNSTARRLGFGADAEALLQDFIARTPAVVDQVHREVPLRFSQFVLNKVLSGLLRAARALEKMPAD